MSRSPETKSLLTLKDICDLYEKASTKPEKEQFAAMLRTQDLKITDDDDFEFLVTKFDRKDFRGVDLRFVSVEKLKEHFHEIRCKDALFTPQQLESLLKPTIVFSTVLSNVFRPKGEGLLFNDKQRRKIAKGVRLQDMTISSELEVLLRKHGRTDFDKVTVTKPSKPAAHRARSVQQTNFEYPVKEGLATKKQGAPVSAKLPPRADSDDENREKLQRALGAYKPGFFTQSNESKVASEHLKGFLPGMVWVGKKTTIAQALDNKKVVKLKEGKSTFAKTLAEHGLAHVSDALLLNRVKAIVSEYEGKRFGFSFLRLQSQGSLNLVSALKSAKTRDDVITAFIVNASEGGTLEGIIKENGLSEFAKDCRTGCVTIAPQPSRTTYNK